MKKAYWGWYKYIRNDINNKSVGIEAEVEIEIEGWDMQWPESLLYLIRELKLDK